MYKLNPDLCVWSVTPPVCVLSQHSETCALLSHQDMEMEDEDSGEVPVLCFCNPGCDDFVHHAADDQQPTSEPPLCLGIPSRLKMSEHNPGSLSSDNHYQSDLMSLLINGNCEEGPRMGMQGWGCVHRQPALEHLDPCLFKPPILSHGVRTNLAVELQLVQEEIFVEDTIEVRREDVYTDDQFDLEMLHNELYSTQS